MTAPPTPSIPRRPSLLRRAVCAALLVPGQVPGVGRPFLELARLFAGTYKSRRFLGGVTRWPWISPRAEYRFAGVARFGRDVFIDDHCVIYGLDPSCRLVLGDRVSLYRGCTVQLGQGGSLEVGEDTHIQDGTIITAMGPVRIGRQVQIAPRCAFFPYDHGFVDATVPIMRQPLRSKGGIVVEDDAWLGVGVVVLDGVRIGRGAVVGAGAVVTRDVPPFTVVAGVPARTIGARGEAPGPGAGLEPRRP